MKIWLLQKKVQNSVTNCMIELILTLTKENMTKALVLRSPPGTWHASGEVHPLIWAPWVWSFVFVAKDLALVSSVCFPQEAQYHISFDYFMNYITYKNTVLLSHPNMRNPVGLFSECPVWTLSPPLLLCCFSAVILQEDLHLLLMFKHSPERVVNLHKQQNNHIINNNNLYFFECMRIHHILD